MPLEMSQDATVLIVDAQHFHPSLEEQLGARQVFVEHAGAADALSVASVLVPDLVVISGKSGADSLAVELHGLRPAVPTLVVADRAQVKRLRALDLPLAALVPHDLPTAAIAHRIATMARRAAQGDLGDRKSAPGIAAPAIGAKPIAAAPSAAVLEPKTHSDEKPVLSAPRVSTQPQASTKAAAVKGADGSAAQGTRKVVKDAQPRAVKPLPHLNPTRDVRTASETVPTASLKSTLPGVAVPPQVAELIAARKPSVTQKGPAETVAHADLSSKSLRPGQFVPLPLSEIDPDSILLSETDARAQSLLTRAMPGRNGASDELSMVAQLPIDLRVPLSSSKKANLALRLAYLDTDLTRADRLTTALRRKGLDVFPLTPDVEQTRWPLLRRFAPQALIVDEKAMARRSADWVETFRGDPFLRHVPLIVVRLSRLYHEQDESVDLEPLLILIERLGQDETALLEKLAPARQVDLKLAQLGPGRLLQLLTEQDRNTRIDCRTPKDRLVWPLGPGYAGYAKLLHAGSEKVIAKLAPRDALLWLLKHEDLDVAVHEHTEPLAHASESVDAVELLRETTDALGIPRRHESVRPADFRSRPDTDSHSSMSLAGATIDSRSPGPSTQASPDRRPHDHHELPHATPMATALPAFQRVLDQQDLRASRTFSRVLKDGYRAYVRRVDPWAAHLPAPLRPHAAPAALAVLGLLLLVIPLWLASNAGQKPAASPTLTNDRGVLPPPPSHATPTPKASDADGAQQDHPPSSDAPPSVLPQGEDASLRLWLVAPDSKKPNCEQIVGDRRPLTASPLLGKSQLQSARKLLMVGKTEQAVELMCLSAFNDETGLGPESLAEHYLSRRSLSEAERWINISLKSDPTRRKSLDLQADIENQKGNWEQSRALLLKTMRLTGSEVGTLQAIGRKLMADARQATKGGDLPRAERELRRAAVLAPKSGGIALELAQVLAERGQSQAALAWAEHAYVLDPTLSAALYYAGNLAAKIGQTDAAHKYFERIVPGDPLYTKANARRAELNR